MASKLDVSHVLVTLVTLYVMLCQESLRHEYNILTHVLRQAFILEVKAFQASGADAPGSVTITSGTHLQARFSSYVLFNCAKYAMMT